jgi:hypothetical protein
LTVGLESEADVGAADLVGALVPFDHAPAVVRHVHFQGGNAEAGDPFAEAVLAVPLGVPVGKDENRGASCGFDRGTPVGRGGPKAGVDSVVLGPGRFDGTRESKNVFPVEVVIGGWSSGEPVGAVFDGVFRVLADEFSGGRVGGIAADMLQAPVEGLDAAVVVGGPATVLVTADFAFEPVHGSSQQLTVYS